jgi:hypothetical protein
MRAFMLAGMPNVRYDRASQNAYVFASKRRDMLPNNAMEPTARLSFGKDLRNQRATAHRER